MFIETSSIYRDHQLSIECLLQTSKDAPWLIWAGEEKGTGTGECLLYTRHLLCLVLCRVHRPTVWLYRRWTLKMSPGDTAHWKVWHQQIPRVPSWEVRSSNISPYFLGGQRPHSIAQVAWGWHMSAFHFLPQPGASPAPC